jgi:hypothetical protein
MGMRVVIFYILDKSGIEDFDTFMVACVNDDEDIEPLKERARKLGFSIYDNRPDWIVDIESEITELES